MYTSGPPPPVWQKTTLFPDFFLLPSLIMWQEKLSKCISCVWMYSQQHQEILKLFPIIYLEDAGPWLACKDWNQSSESYQSRPKLGTVWGATHPYARNRVRHPPSALLGDPAYTFGHLGFCTVDTQRRNLGSNNLMWRQAKAYYGHWTVTVVMWHGRPRWIASNLRNWPACNRQSPADRGNGQ